MKRRQKKFSKDDTRDRLDLEALLRYFFCCCFSDSKCLSILHLKICHIKMKRKYSKKSAAAPPPQFLLHLNDPSLNPALVIHIYHNTCKNERFKASGLSITKSCQTENFHDPVKNLTMKPAKTKLV